MSVRWKEEDEACGEPVGPVLVGDGVAEPRPFDPNRTSDNWVTLSEAREIADRCGVELEIA